MTFSINSFNNAAQIIFLLIIWLSGCAPKNGPARNEINHPPVLEKTPLIAVLPLANLSGTPVPLRDVRQSLINSFDKLGLNLLDEETLERFIVRHRLRYVGGIDRITARDLKFETGADAVLITSVELYSETPPPKLALTLRLIATGSDPRVLWAHGVGLAGNDTIGILELSLIEDPQVLMRNALLQLSTSLGEYISSGGYTVGTEREIIKFWPEVFYRSPIIEPGISYTVAVVPFFNLSERRFAGDLMALHFVRQLSGLGNFKVIEPGIVRRVLLKRRIIMEDGMSLADADLLFSELDADVILSGKVFDYQDYKGPAGKPKVDFSALLTEKKSREVVWACESYYDGDYGVFFFDWGKINTAHRMADEMVASALATLGE